MEECEHNFVEMSSEYRGWDVHRILEWCVLCGAIKTLDYCDNREMNVKIHYPESYHGDI